MIRTSRRLRSQRGQMLIIFAMLIAPVTFAVGVVAVDAAAWQSERRGAQKDADLTALAGALTLLDPEASVDDAMDAVEEYATINDETGSGGARPENLVEVTVNDSCWEDRGRLDAVAVDLEHDTRGFFTSIFNVPIPQPGAHAKACVGAAQDVTFGNLVPFQIDDDFSPCFADEEPVFTQFCPLEYGAGGGPGGSPAARGLIDLDAPDGFCSDTAGGVNNTAEHIEWGSPADCSINPGSTCSPVRVGPWENCVSVQPGNAKRVLDGTHARIIREHDLPDCDDNGNDDHEFDEVLEVVVDNGDPSQNLYAPIDCDPDTEGTQISSRLVTIVVFEERANPNASNGVPIKAFAGFLITGCASEVHDIVDEDDPRLNRDCEVGPGGSGPPGRVVVYGQFVNLITTGGGIGEPTTSSSIFGITLVE